MPAALTGLAAALAWLLLLATWPRRHQPAGAAFATVATLASLSLSLVAMQHLIADPAARAAFARLQVGLFALSPAVSLLAVLRFAPPRRAAWRLLHLALVPAVAGSLALWLTPFAPGFPLEAIEPLDGGPAMLVTPGPWFWGAIVPYGLFLLLIAVARLFGELRRDANDAPRRRYGVTLLLALLMPLVTAALHGAGVLTLPLLTTAALGAALSTLVLLVGGVASGLLAEPEVGFRDVFEAMHEAALVVAADGTVKEANPAALRLLGLDGADAARGRALLGLAPQLEVARRAQAHASEPRRLAGDLDGFEASVSHLRDARQRLHACLIVVHDERKDRLREQRLRSAANRDALTGVANRAGFDAALREALARRGSSAVGLVYTDLDGFKPINDGHGHAVGDTVLVEVARRLEAASRGTDVVGRLGGDEFCVLLEDVTPAGLAAVAARVRHALQTPIRAGALHLQVGVSLGLASAPRDGTSAPDLLRAADARMYRDKAAKTDRYGDAETPSRSTTSTSSP